VSVGALDPVGSFLASATYAPQNALRLEAAFKEEIVQALKDGFTAEELEGARKGWLQARGVTRSQDGTLASRINALAYFDRTLAWDADLERKVKVLAVDDVNRALRRFVDLDKMIIVKAGDFANAARHAGTGATKQ
jgi:zinc protease